MIIIINTMKKIIFITIFIILIFSATNYFSNRHFTVVFKNLRPFDGRIDVYYKGVLIGKATDKVHSNDSLRTNVRITLKNKKLNLPLNTQAILKKRMKYDQEIDYIELIYPEIPSQRFIRENSHIHGYSTIDIKEYLKNQSTEDLDKIKSNLMSSSANLSSSLEAIGGMFILIQDILQENRANLKGSSSNLKSTTENINRLTKKIDNIIIEEQWNNTFNNIESSTGGLHKFAYNINDTVSEFDKTMPTTLENANEITDNLRAITCGIRQTLSKKFGGLRLFCGKVIN